MRDIWLVAHQPLCDGNDERGQSRGSKTAEGKGRENLRRACRGSGRRTEVIDLQGIWIGGNEDDDGEGKGEITRAREETRNAYRPVDRPAGISASYRGH